ncbi:MAG TPA: histidinol-phosphate transaminase [Acidimicrobiales bacterium]|nr:histidinol-phosphate transaminase [Acidimicrobiales bacterium]
MEPRPWINAIAPYVPGQPAATRDGSMASNESTFPVSRRVADAVNAVLDGVSEYPDPLANGLREALAALHDVDPDQILVGNGSDELVYLLVLTYAGHGGRVLCAKPSYRIDEVSAAVVGADVAYVPLVDWRHDLVAMATVPADVAFVVNPHNPTGTTCAPDEIASFVDTARARLSVVDEAYIDFADIPEEATAIPLARRGDAVVLRTFSKVFGLAGARVGYLVGSADLVATLRKVRAPFSVSSFAQAAAVAGLADRDHYHRARTETVARRAELVRLLVDRGFEVVPSQANFVLARCEGEAALVAHLAASGISVRPGSALGVPGAIRVSVPSAEGLRLLAGALPDADQVPTRRRTP